MKLVVDSSVFIEYLRGHQPFFFRLRGILERGDVVAFEPIFAELLQGAKDQREIDLIKNLYDNLNQVSEQGVWVDAGVLSAQQKLFKKGVGIIDAAIVAFASRYQLKVYTLDKKLLSILPGNLVYI